MTVEMLCCRMILVINCAYKSAGRRREPGPEYISPLVPPHKLFSVNFWKIRRLRNGDFGARVQGDDESKIAFEKANAHPTAQRLMLVQGAMLTN